MPSSRLLPIIAAVAGGMALHERTALAEAPWGEVEIHGFVSQGAIWTTDNNYLADSERGSFEFSDVGVNLTKRVTDRLRIGMQLFSRKLGPVGNYNAKFDWYYLDYQWKDWLGLRAGRLKLPFGLYNDTSDIDAARVAILLPPSVYPLDSHDYLLAQTGVELYGRHDLGGAGALDYRIYGGTIYVPPANLQSPGLSVQSITTPYLVGGRLMWETPLEGLRVGASVQALRFDADVTVAGMPLSFRLPAVLSVASAEYVADALVLAAEYSRWWVSLETSDQAILPDVDRQVSERGYVLATYRINPWLQPGAYYSLMFPNIDNRSRRENVQHDAAATLRFDIDDNWLFKLEAHAMHGTAGLSPSLNDGRSQAELERNWLVVLAKVTAYF